MQKAQQEMKIGPKNDIHVCSFCTKAFNFSLTSNMITFSNFTCLLHACFGSNYFTLIEGGLKYELENVFYLQYRQHGFLERVLWFKKKRGERTRKEKHSA